MKQMLARIRQGNPGYDIIVPSGGTVQRMAEEMLLIPLDLDMIPNVANVIPDLAGRGLRSRERVLPALSVGHGRRRLSNRSIPRRHQLLGPGMGSRWSGGLARRSADDAWHRAFDFWATIPTRTDPDEINAARDYLISRTVAMWSLWPPMTDRSCWSAAMSISRSNTTATFCKSLWDCECDDYAYAIPDEGSNVWIDNLSIPVDAPNPELAMVFIDYILDAKVGADLTNYICLRLAEPGVDRVRFHRRRDPEVIRHDLPAGGASWPSSSR